MAKEKYYTPDSEELHPNMDVEIFVNGEEWIPLWIRYSHFCAFLDTEDPFFLNQIRVKYLSAKDIKDLGWEYRTEHKAQGGEIYSKHTYSERENDTTEIYLFYNKLRNHLLIWKEYSPADIQETVNLFVGKCYNKSELKWVMNRLDIKTEKRE